MQGTLQLFLIAPFFQLVGSIRLILRVLNRVKVVIHFQRLLRLYLRFFKSAHLFANSNKTINIQNINFRIKSKIIAKINF